MRVSVAERSDTPHDFTQSAVATGNGIGNGAGIALIPRGCTEGCTPRAFAASPAGPARLTKPFPLGSEGRNGRYWARTSDPQLVEFPRQMADHGISLQMARF
jgi:hypothetical protein